MTNICIPANMPSSTAVITVKSSSNSHNYANHIFHVYINKNSYKRTHTHQLPDNCHEQVKQVNKSQPEHVLATHLVSNSKLFLSSHHSQIIMRIDQVRAGQPDWDGVEQRRCIRHCIHGGQCRTVVAHKHYIYIFITLYIFNTYIVYIISIVKTMHCIGFMRCPFTDYRLELLWRYYFVVSVVRRVRLRQLIVCHFTLRYILFIRWVIQTDMFHF